MAILTHFNSLLAPAVVAVGAAISSSSWALEPGRGGFVRTGEGVRTSSTPFPRVKLYALTHEMKRVPASKSKRAVIELDADKKFTLRLLCPMAADRLRESLRDAFLMNGYADAQKIRAFLGAITKDLREGQYLTIVYEADTKCTTLTVQGDGSTTLEGIDFMQAAWSVWFGKIDQPALGDALLSRLH